MKTQLKKGVMDMLVLAQLQQHDRYGYDLVARISEHIEISEGTMYPLCSRLKRDALVETYMKESDAGPARKYYRITEAGRAALLQMQAEWSDFQEAINGLLRDTEA